MCIALVSRANVVVAPWQLLSGESVCVRINSEAAEISGVYEFADWNPGNSIYFPIFAGYGDSASKCLAEANLRVKMGELNLTDITPCEAPAGVREVEGGPKVFWFKIGSDDRKAEELIKEVGSIRISVEFKQRLLAQEFYYLPVIPTRAKQAPSERAWRYQMVVRSLNKVSSVVSSGVDYERFGDSLVVYLKDQQIVEIK